METIELPPNHKRVISVTAKTIEEVLDELEIILAQKRNNSKIKKIIPSFSDDERSYMIELITELREINNKMFEELNLNSSELSELQLVRGKINYLWTVLIDSKAKTLKGYGELPENTAQVLDKYIDNFLEILSKFN